MSDVLLFPPLPPLPEAPAAPVDERQLTFYRIRTRLTGQESRPQDTRGFRASAVDLGVLQDKIEAGIARFTMEQLRERWDVDVRKWVARVCLTWIQRCKAIHFEIGETGVSLTIQTQDDRGYYEYQLDVFPQRAGISREAP